MLLLLIQWNVWTHIKVNNHAVMLLLVHNSHCEAIWLLCSNPMAGTDATLLALSGAGYTDSRSFGFASCPRVVGAAEGMNVLLERRMQKPDGQIEHAYNVTNVEYTEFEKQGICDVPASPGSQYSCFPANTNVLYVGLKVGLLLSPLLLTSMPSVYTLSSSH